MNNADFGMYSAEGNAMIADLIHGAKTLNLTWPKVFNLLADLAQEYPQVAGEATDTEVRECVYRALGFTTPFYI